MSPEDKREKEVRKLKQQQAMTPPRRYWLMMAQIRNVGDNGWWYVSTAGVEAGLKY